MIRAVLCLQLAFAAVVLVACGGGRDTTQPAGKSDGKPDGKPGAASSGARDSAEIREAWADRVRSERAAKVEKATADLNDAEKAVADAQKRLKKTISDGTTVSVVTKMKADIAALQAKRDRAKSALDAAPSWEPRIEIRTIRVGEFGVLGVGEVYTPPLKVLQIIDRSTALLQYQEQVFWVEGLGTSALADGHHITLSQIVECTGNKTYTTPLGTTRTVLVLKVHGQP